MRKKRKYADVFGEGAGTEEESQYMEWKGPVVLADRAEQPLQPHFVTPATPLPCHPRHLVTSPTTPTSTP